MAYREMERENQVSGLEYQKRELEVKLERAKDGHFGTDIARGS